MEVNKAKSFLLEELSNIRRETLDDIDLSVHCQWANERAKKRAKDRLGEFERMIKELLSDD